MSVSELLSERSTTGGEVSGRRSRRGSGGEATPRNSAAAAAAEAEASTGEFMLVETIVAPGRLSVDLARLAAKPSESFGGMPPFVARSLLPLLRRYVPPAVVPRLQEGIDSYYDLSEMRQVSVMFVNCVGLALYSGGGVSDAEEAVAAGQETMLLVSEEVVHMEGQVNKMLVDDKGTVFLCVFGLPPRPHADDPKRAVRTGLLLKALLDGDGDESNGVTASIGIASGRAFCGVVGSTVGERREFTVMGDVVNVSARLMGLASKARAPSRLLIDECTQSYTEKFIMSRRCPPQRLKGKAKLMTVYTPEKEIEQTKQSTTIGRLGRDAEYLHLRGMVAELLVFHGGGGTILLLGGRGSGKGALISDGVSAANSAAF